MIYWCADSESNKNYFYDWTKKVWSEKETADTFKCSFSYPLQSLLVIDWVYKLNLLWLIHHNKPCDGDVICLCWNDVSAIMRTKKGGKISNKIFQKICLMISMKNDG